MPDNVVGGDGASVSSFVEPERPRQRRRRIVVLDENGNNVVLDLDSEERRALRDVLEELGTERF